MAHKTRAISFMPAMAKRTGDKAMDIVPCVQRVHTDTRKKFKAHDQAIKHGLARLSSETTATKNVHHALTMVPNKLTSQVKRSASMFDPMTTGHRMRAKRYSRKSRNGKY